jgi:TRAP-type mannitol/chloroaromatic compound transport system substrate-binding protein
MRGSLVIGVVALIVGVLIGTYVLGPSQGPATTASNGGGETATAAAGIGDPVRWKMASSFPGELVQLGDQGRALQTRIGQLSNGNMEVKFFEPGALVPALEIFDAVSSGSINAGWTASGYWAGKVPAMQFFTAVPFGPNAGELVAWLFHGGGIELWTELYQKHNIHSMPCNMISPEGSGWFTKEINTLDDFKGLKMRFFGLGAKVMEKLGVSTQLLAGGDIFPALELGTIDATEFSMPAIDLDLGFHQVAKHYYFPGWHQPLSVGEFMINLDNWNSLSTTQQEIINAVCKENMIRGFAQSEAIQHPAMEKLQDQGVQFHRWSPEILAALEQAWMEVVTEEAAADVDFNRVWTSLSEFREGYKLWGELGYLK